VKTLADGQAAVLTQLAASAKQSDANAHNAGVEAVISASVQAGKVVPASVKAKSDDGKYKLDAASAKEIMDCIPATVQTQFQEGQAQAGTGLTTETTAEAEVCAALAIDQDAWKKGGLKRAWEPAPSGVKVA
jgi:major membrane immunogen (membrane-anchored lipoprotein)